MVKRPRVILVFCFLAVFGIVACGSTQTGSSTNSPTDASSTTLVSSPTTSPSAATQAPVKVTGVAIAINPGNISTIACGTATNIVFIATISSASGSGGGQVPYTWNINHTNIPGSVTFAPGETTKTVTYTLKGYVVQLNSASGVSGIIVVGNPGSSINSSAAGLIGVCRLPGPFQVTGIAITVNPASIAEMPCNTALTVVYTATITIAPNSNAGTVHLVWDIQGFHTPAYVTFGATETVKTIVYTNAGKLVTGNSNGFPRPASIAATSPNAVNSITVKPTGLCK